MDMKNIDWLAVRGDYKEVLRQPTLIAKDLTLNSNQNGAWKGKTQF